LENVCLDHLKNESFCDMKSKVLVSIPVLIIEVVLVYTGYYTSAVIAIILFLLIFASLLFSERHKNDVDLIPNLAFENIQTVTETYGTPDDIVVVNPTRGNQLDGVILVYDEKGFLYINGIILNKNEITDVSFFNAANPYMSNEYQIVIKTTSERNPSVYISVGNELGWAKNVLFQIKGHLGFNQPL
jgi:hypothetical protein